MTRQRWSSLSLTFALAVVASACGAGSEELGDSGSFINTSPPAADTGAVVGPIDAGTVVVPDSGAIKPPPTQVGVDSGARDSGPAIVVITDAGLGGSDSAVTADGGVTGDAGSVVTAPGSCCPDGKCICREPPPAKLDATKGKYKVATVQGKTGVIHYPTDATPPFAAIALCGGFTNTGPEMTPWGPFYASHGIVVLITATDGLDDPATRATKLLASVTELKGLSTGPLAGKIATDRLGTSGYSMGGGGTVIAASRNAELKTSIGLAAFQPTGMAMVKTPTLLFCGTDDIIAGCADNSDPAYTAIPNSTPKMKMMITGGDHLTSWFGPADAGPAISGGYGLAFQKVFLEGDERWRAALLMKPAGSTQVTNIMAK